MCTHASMDRCMHVYTHDTYYSNIRSYRVAWYTYNECRENRMGYVGTQFLVVISEFQTTHLSSDSNPTNFWVSMPNYFKLSHLVITTSFCNGYFTFQNNGLIEMMIWKTVKWTCFYRGFTGNCEVQPCMSVKLYHIVIMTCIITIL